MSACVSPPQCSTSHIVEVAAIMAQAASTALPPRSKILAPAVAPSGLPVIAIQCRPCSGGFWVLAIERATAGEYAWPWAGGMALVLMRVRLSAARAAIDLRLGSISVSRSMRWLQYAAPLLSPL